MTGFRDLRGKRVLLTGASRGLGRVVARALAREGAELVLTARDRGRLDAVAAECREHGAGAAVVVADVSRAEDRARLIEQAGIVDVLVNNAAAERTVRFSEACEADVDDLVRTNLDAPLHLCRLVLPGMVARGSGVIVNVSSLSGKTATPFEAVYTATKYGLNGFTAALAMELEGTGVHAGVVCPGFVAEAGMWADTGARPPPGMREVRPAKVARAVLSVIRGAREVLVASLPMRPYLALVQLIPGLEPRVVRATGVYATFEAEAKKRRGRAD